MTQVTTHAGFTQEAFDAFLQARREPAWQREMRLDAWSDFQGKSMPARNEEEWIRTDIRLFKLDRYTLSAPEAEAGELPACLLDDGVELAGQALSLDGRVQTPSLDQRWASRGVLFGDLEELTLRHEKLLRPYFEQRVTAPGKDIFSALHAACWSGGRLLYVPRGVTVDQPFHAGSILSDGGADFGKTLVILEDGAEATLLMEQASLSESGSGLHCGSVEMIVGPRSNLRFVSLQDWGHGVWHFAHQKAIVDQDASLQWTIASMGSRLAKVNQHVALVGRGANTQVNGVLFTEGKQHMSYHTLQHHQAEACRSDFLYKAALQDHSRTVWRGMIKVDPAAQKTDGYQRNDNLLLSSSARADSIPGLEIEADDVRCTHGSTTGRVDEELVFYAQCRGFTRREAIRTIVTGFFQQIFDRVTIESVREALGHAIARRVREYD